jgi:hypothetical protein
LQEFVADAAASRDAREGVAVRAARRRVPYLIVNGALAWSAVPSWSVTRAVTKP